MTDPDSDTQAKCGYRVPVTWGTIMVAFYVVVAGVGMGIAGTFFSETWIGGLFKDGPVSLPWLLVLFVPAFLIEKLWNFVVRWRKRRR